MPFGHLQERHEVVVLRVVVQPAGAEPREVVSEDRVLDEDLQDVVVDERQIRHLESEREHVDGYRDEECLPACVVDAAPPVRSKPLQGCIDRRFHRNVSGKLVYRCADGFLGRLTPYRLMNVFTSALDAAR